MAAVVLTAALVSCAPAPVATGTATPSSTNTPSPSPAVASATPVPTVAAVTFPDVPLVAGTAFGDLMRWRGASWQLEAHVCPQDRGQDPVTALSVSGDGRIALVQCARRTGTSVTDPAREAYVYDFTTKTARAIGGTTELGIGPVDPNGTSAVIGARGECPAPAPTCQSRWLELDLVSGKTRELLPSWYWYSVEFRWTALGLSYYLPAYSNAGVQPPERVGTFTFDGRTGAPIRFSAHRLIAADANGHAVLERTTSLVLNNPRPPSAVIERTNAVEELRTPASVAWEHPIALLADGRIVAWRPDGPDSDEVHGRMIVYDRGRVVRETVGTFARGDALRAGDWLVSKLFLGGGTYDLSAYSISADAFVTRSAGIAIGAMAVLPGANAVIARATEVLAALKVRDGTKLAALTDPIKGVRFTPYPYVQTDKDVVLSAADITRAFTDPQLRAWGISDGKGDPIRLTFTDYVGRYAYDRDYLSRAEVSVDRTQGNGNTIDNTKVVYPAATLVEFYQPSSPNALDWRAVRLLFEQRSGIWYLVAIVHGEWTI